LWLGLISVADFDRNDAESHQKDPAMSILKFAPFGRPASPAMRRWAFNGIENALENMGTERVALALTYQEDPSDDYIAANEELSQHFGAEFDFGDYNYEFVVSFFQKLYGEPVA
jgi:hypothetical protein